jgi:hypothetical protein
MKGVLNHRLLSCSSSFFPFSLITFEGSVDPLATLLIEEEEGGCSTNKTLQDIPGGYTSLFQEMEKSNLASHVYLSLSESQLPTKSSSTRMTPEYIFLILHQKWRREATYEKPCNFLVSDSCVFPFTAFSESS